MVVLVAVVVLSIAVQHTTFSNSSCGRQTCKFYSVSQKNPAWRFLRFFPKQLGVFSPNFTCLLYVPIYARLQIFIQLVSYLQLWRSYAILRATTPFTSYVQNVRPRLAFSDIFPKQLGIFSPSFTHLLPNPLYARLQILQIISNCDEVVQY